MFQEFYFTPNGMDALLRFEETLTQWNQMYLGRFRFVLFVFPDTNNAGISKYEMFDLEHCSEAQMATQVKV